MSKTSSSRKTDGGKGDADRTDFAKYQASPFWRRKEEATPPGPDRITDGGQWPNPEFEKKKTKG